MSLQDVPSVLVGGLTFEVIEDPDNMLVENKNRIGEHDQLAATLTVATRNIAPQIQAQTLLHEVFHALGAVYMEGRVLDEVDVAALSQGFFQVLRNNPKLVEFIQNPITPCCSPNRACVCS